MTPVFFTKLDSSNTKEVIGFKDQETGIEMVKLYFSTDHKRVRVVIPELENFAQVKIDPDHHLIDIERSPRSAKQSIIDREKKLRGF